jgi:hypothetical protein
MRLMILLGQVGIATSVTDGSSRQRGRDRRTRSVAEDDLGSLDGLPMSELRGSGACARPSASSVGA